MDRDTILNDWAETAGWCPKTFQLDLVGTEALKFPEPNEDNKMTLWVGDEQTLMAFALLVMSYTINHPDEIMEFLNANP